MKNEEFAHTTLFGVVDITSRSEYRADIASLVKQLEEADKEVAKLKTKVADLDAAVQSQKKNLAEYEKVVAEKERQIEAQNNSIEAAAEAYNALERRSRDLEKELVMAEEKVSQTSGLYNEVCASRNELQGAYNDAKRRLAKFERQRGAGGRFKKKSEPQE